MTSRPGWTRLLFGLLFFAGCAMQGRQSLPARLRIVAVPATARVYVDDRFAGSARVFDAHPRELRAGAHQITLQAPGYFPHDLELELPSGTTTVRIRLRAVPP